MSDVRQRKKGAASTNTPAARAKAEDAAPFSILDIARSLVFLLIASSALSYFVTKDSFIWGVKRPQWTRLEVIKSYISGPQQFTHADLKKYDGSNPELPLLLAINGTIYDVSAGRRHYGPGGSYHAFAGVDASRAFVTTCLDEDRNPDMRGLEEMYIPLDNPEVDNLYSSGELKKLKALEKKLAKIEVHKALKHWVDFFEGSGKYPKVGKVKRDPDWEKKLGPVPKLCKMAADGRPKSRRPPPGK